jgi:hypothetical protein
MKKIIFLTLAAVGFVSCEKDEKATVSTESANITAEVSATTFTLDKTKAGENALTVSWNKTALNVATPVRYNVTLSYNGNSQSTELTTHTSTTLTVATLNTLCMKLGMPVDTATPVELKANVVLGDKKIVASSAPKTLTITRYNQDFYIVGDASYVGWNANKAQQLYQEEDGVNYAIYTYLVKEQEFRFLGQQDWNPANYSLEELGVRDNYKYFKKYTNKYLQKGGTGNDGTIENIKFYGETGIYKVSINITDQSLTIEETTADYKPEHIYLVGDGVSGTPKWKIENPVEMTKTAEGVFETTVVLQPGAEFKFFGQKSWSGKQWGNFTKDVAGDTRYLAPKDNSNIKFNGDGSSNYKITVNVKAGTYSVVKQ